MAIELKQIIIKRTKFTRCVSESLPTGSGPAHILSLCLNQNLAEWKGQTLQAENHNGTV